MKPQVLSADICGLGQHSTTAGGGAEIWLCRWDLHAYTRVLRTSCRFKYLATRVQDLEHIGNFTQLTSWRPVQAGVLGRCTAAG